MKSLITMTDTYIIDHAPFIFTVRSSLHTRTQKTNSPMGHIPSLLGQLQGPESFRIKRPFFLSKGITSSHSFYHMLLTVFVWTLQGLLERKAANRGEARLL